MSDLSAICTGYTPETDEAGQEKWPRGDEKVWKAAIRGVDKGEQLMTLGLSSVGWWVLWGWNPYPVLDLHPWGQLKR